MEMFVLRLGGYELLPTFKPCLISPLNPSTLSEMDGYSKDACSPAAVLQDMTINFNTPAPKALVRNVPDAPLVNHSPRSYILNHSWTNSISSPLSSPTKRSNNPIGYQFDTGGSGVSAFYQQLPYSSNLELNTLRQLSQCPAGVDVTSSVKRRRTDDGWRNTADYSPSSSAESYSASIVSSASRFPDFNSFLGGSQSPDTRRSGSSYIEDTHEPYHLTHSLENEHSSNEERQPSVLRRASCASIIQPTGRLLGRATQRHVSDHVGYRTQLLDKRQAALDTIHTPSSSPCVRLKGNVKLDLPSRYSSTSFIAPHSKDEAELPSGSFTSCDTRNNAEDEVYESDLPLLTRPFKVPILSLYLTQSLNESLMIVGFLRQESLNRGPSPKDRSIWSDEALFAFDEGMSRDDLSYGVDP